MATIGGSVASQRSAIEYVEQLEVVLANGDVLQTKRLTKRELEKKKGQQNFEGEIYRGVDGLIEDNPDLLDAMTNDDNRLDHEGYAGLEMVKEKNGSFDLTPLFVGSQGSLGVISEMILKADFVNQNPSMVVAAFAEIANARDALDDIDDIDPSAVEYIDGKYFEAAKMAGKSYSFYDEAKEQFTAVQAVIVVTINDFNERARTKKMKRLLAKLKPHGAHLVSESDYNNSDLRALGSATYWLLNPEKPEFSSPPVLDGMYVPLDRFDVFTKELDDLMKHHHVALALYGRPLDELWYVRPLLRMTTVADKQKLFKLTADLASLAKKHNGSPFGAGGDGRIGAGLRIESDRQQELFNKLKTIFDPNRNLNPGVKQDTTVRDLARQLRSSYDGPSATSHLAKF
jgi:FAD/FMN-containing dehydrogenase